MALGGPPIKNTVVLPTQLAKWFLPLHPLSISHKKKSLALMTSTRASLSTLVVKAHQPFMINKRTSPSTLAINDQPFSKISDKQTDLHTKHMSKMQTTLLR
jgi:hypothetical protein